MRPNNEALIQKCELETQKLFQLFLEVNQVKTFQETNEVQYHVRERDSQVRSGSFGSSSYGSSNSLTGSSGNISTRGLDDISKFDHAIKRNSLNSRIGFSPPTGVSNLSGSSPSLSTLESDSARTPPSAAPFLPGTPPSVGIYAKSESSGGVVRRAASAEKVRRKQRPHSSSPSFPSFAPQPRSRSNTGPSEEMLTEAARTIAAIGDNIEDEYADKMSKMKNDLMKFLAENTAPSYECFAAEVNHLVGEDRNWTYFVLVMQLGKRILSTGHAGGTRIRNYFSQFLGTAFSEEVARYGNADQYVRDHTTARPVNNEK